MGTFKKDRVQRVWNARDYKKGGLPQDMIDDLKGACKLSGVSWALFLKRVGRGWDMWVAADTSPQARGLVDRNSKEGMRKYDRERRKAHRRGCRQEEAKVMDLWS
jgi:hypothetical protein